MPPYESEKDYNLWCGWEGRVEKEDALKSYSLTDPSLVPTNPLHSTRMVEVHDQVHDHGQPGRVAFSIPPGWSKCTITVNPDELLHVSWEHNLSLNEILTCVPLSASRSFRQFACSTSKSFSCLSHRSLGRSVWCVFTRYKGRSWYGPGEDPAILFLSRLHVQPIHRLLCRMRYYKCAFAF
jgi:hypothetical protein